LSLAAWSANGIKDIGFTASIIVILLAGLLLGWKAGVLVTLLSILAGWFFAYAEANELLITRYDEPIGMAVDTSLVFIIIAVLLTLTISSLSSALKKARESEQSLANNNQELQAIQDQLEMRVAEQTRDLALAAEIGRNIAQTRDVDDLLKSSVERIRSRFDLYYAQIYLTNDYKTGLELTAATGSVGEYLLAQGHRLAIDAKSINSLAALEKRPVIVSDTAQSPLFKPNPSLPYTRSEMAIPLLAGQNVLGVLDLQATNTGALSEDNLPAFEALAGQIAIALENASLFREQARLTDALKENTEREAENARFLDSVIENLPVMLFVKDAENLRFLRWNKAGSDLIGLPAEAFIGKTDYDFFPEDEAEFFIRKDREVLNNGVLVDIPEEPIQTVDKGTRLLHTVKVPILDAAGKAQYLLGVSQDITEQKEAEKMLGERVKELNLLNEIGRKTDEKPAITEFLAFIAGRIPGGMMYPELCCAAITLDGDIYGEPQAIDLPCQMVEGLRLDGELVGRVYIAYTENRVFLNEESALIGDIGRRITNYIVNQRLLARVQHTVEGLQTVAEVGAAITTTMNPNQLLQSIVDLTKTQFGFYHAHIYLYEESSNTLVLAAGAGDIGRQMVAESRQIPLTAPRSLVARSAREQKALVVGDVQAEPGFLAHPLLPETQSELAVPLTVGGLLLGVLDIQSSEKNGFTAEDVNVQMTLASQIAVALQNAGQYQQTQDALEEVSALQKTLTREGWQAFITAVDRPIQGFSASHEGIQPIMAAARPPTNGHQDDNSLVYPISVQGTAIGHLGLKTSKKELTADDLALVESITAQVAEALERARLFEQTESARSQTEALFSGSEQVVRAATPDDVLQAVVQSTSLHEYERASLHLFNQPWQSVQPESMVMAAFWRRDGQPSILPVGVSMPLAQYPIVQYLQREEPLVFKDILADPRVDENTRSLFIDILGMRSVLAVPLVAGDQWIGFVLGYSDEPYHILESNLRQITSLAGQAATVIQSQQLYQQARTRAEREQILRQVSDRVYAAPDAENVLRTAAREIGEALGLETFIYLENEPDNAVDTAALEPETA
jgi:PAS domain S-box-containing protein